MEVLHRPPIQGGVRKPDHRSSTGHRATVQQSLCQQIDRNCAGSDNDCLHHEKCHHSRDNPIHRDEKQHDERCMITEEVSTHERHVWLLEPRHQPDPLVVQAHVVGKGS